MVCMCMYVCMYGLYVCNVLCGWMFLVLPCVCEHAFAPGMCSRACPLCVSLSPLWMCALACSLYVRACLLLCVCACPCVCALAPVRLCARACSLCVCVIAFPCVCVCVCVWTCPCVCERLPLCMWGGGLLAPPVCARFPHLCARLFQIVCFLSQGWIHYNW